MQICKMQCSKIAFKSVIISSLYIFRMKKNVHVFLFLVIFLSSCVKSNTGCTPQDPAVEKPSMIAFCASNGITYTEHTSGILYQITNPGTGIIPLSTSKIFIYYTGKRLDGTTFDSVNNPSATGWVLNQLIEGWQIGIPLLKKGGSIKMVIPSALAYGCNGSGPIAANSPLYFEVTLVDVQ